MRVMTERWLLIQGLAAHADRLEALLGDEWPAFQEALDPLLRELVAAEDDERALQLADQVVELGLESPAAALVRGLMQQAAEQAGVGYDRQRRLSMVDPTSGRERDLPFGGTGPPAKGTALGATRDDLAAAASELGWAVFQPEVAARPGEAEPRYLNTLFAAPDGETPVPPEWPLVQGESYVLYVDIAERKGLGEDDVPFPDAALDEAWDEETLPLAVVAASHDFEIEAPQVRWLELPRSGPSDGVRFPVRPRTADGRGEIQVEVFYRGHLLQSKAVSAYVVAAAGDPMPPVEQPAQTARIRFTTPARLDPEILARTPERVLAVEAAQDEEGHYDIRFLDRTRGDGELAFYDTRLLPGSLEQAIQGVRNKLLQAITTPVDREGVDLSYQWVLGSDKAEFLLQSWLPQVADAGRLLYRKLLPETQGAPPVEDQGERLQAALEPGTTIQVNPIQGYVTIPWALLYERRFKLRPDRSRVCEAFATCGPECDDCPHANDPYVVCPYAFWGYRYAIEQIPCWVSGERPELPVLLREIDNGRPLAVNVNVYRDFRYWTAHLPKLEAAGEVRVLKAEEIGELEDIWADHGGELDVIYFYSHGGRDEVVLQPYLELSDGRINSNYLEDVVWPHKPLVFLNGCATGDYGPDSYVSLIDDFRAAQASAVVGTECPVPELFAEAYASALFPRLFRGEPLGRAMLEVRLEFLREKKNLLGLVYSLYAASEIALARRVADA